LEQQVTAPSKVDSIIKALSGLEDDIDSLNVKVAESKKALNSKAEKEVESIMEKTTQMAQEEAKSIISQANEKAKNESNKIQASGEAKLDGIKKQIDLKFDEAVELVVSTILKP